MKKAVLFVTMLAALLLLSACNQNQEPTTKPVAATPQPAQPAPPAQPAAATGTATPAPVDMAMGEKIYNETCHACHANGVAGAPKFGDSTAWADRIAQGMNTLDEHAINGYSGTTGSMPARGGNASLSDEQVKAAVAYMVDHSK